VGVVAGRRDPEEEHPRHNAPQPEDQRVELGKGGADLHLAEEQAFHRRPVRSQAGPRVREAHLAEKCAYLIDVRGYAAWTS